MLALIIYDLSCEPLFSTTDVVLIKKIFIHHHQYRLIFNYYNLCEQEKVVGDFIIINVRFHLLVDDNCTHTHTLVVFLLFFSFHPFFVFMVILICCVVIVKTLLLYGSSVNHNFIDICIL